MKSSLLISAAGLATAFTTAPIAAQTAIVVEFPDPASFYLNSTFAVDGEIGYVPSFDYDTLWSFSLTTGDLLDPDGLALPEPGTASDAFLFADGLLAIPGWFPDQGIFVADVSDPADLKEAGVIWLTSSCNIQGQNIEVDEDGVIGYVASFPNDTLYSFNVQDLKLEDPDGLPLPGNPDRIARAGDRVAMVDTLNSQIMVADISDPANLVLAGIIELPYSSYGSNDNIVFHADGRTGFLSSNQRVLFSFDVLDLVLLDPDGQPFGNQQYGDDIAIHGDTVACVWSRGLTFIDVSNPADMAVICDADFGGVVAPQGSATVEFSTDGKSAAMPVIYPDNLVYTFDVATGDRIADPFVVDAQPNYLTISGNAVATLCAGSETSNIWLIDGLLGIHGDVNDDGLVDIDDLFAVLADWGPCPSPPAECPADINGDTVVDIDDVFEVLANWS